MFGIGQHQNVPGNDTCLNCDMGQYMDEVGAVNCLNCIPACSYNYIRDMFPTVNMMLEKNFTQQLETFVQTSHAQNNSIMFAVDDVFFFNRRVGSGPW